jgi:large repetitive protein
MASNILSFAIPQNNMTVKYDLPPTDSAKLSFSSGDIASLNVNDNGALVINFQNGGVAVINNFQSLIDNGHQLYLADNTPINPDNASTLLTCKPGVANDNLAAITQSIEIGLPDQNTVREITLEQGQTYHFAFDLTQTQSAEEKDGTLIVSFDNGGKLIITNYTAAISGVTPIAVTGINNGQVLKNNDLIVSIQTLATGDETTQKVVVLDEEEASRARSKIRGEELQSAQDIGPNDQTALEPKQPEAQTQNQEASAQDDAAKKAAAVEPAAGDEMAQVAQALADVEPAAGPAAAGAGRAGGYGFNSRPGTEPFITNPDIGPINPTALNYNAPVVEPRPFLILSQPDPDTAPQTSLNQLSLDESNLASGPISVAGQVVVDFGADGNGGINPNGTASASGSLKGGVLSHNGQPVTISVEGNNYVGKTPNGDVVFDLVLNPTTGNYTFTQYLPLDHADGANPNDAISINFGVIARDTDGDSVTTSITVAISDDAPTASGASETIDETNLGPIVETGSITVNFGEDGAGKVEPSEAFTSSGSLKNGALTSNGVAVSVVATPTGYEGRAGSTLVFTLEVNPTTGAYTYTQFKGLDHADNSNPNDIITLSFGTNVVDFDGDRASAPIVINIKDDAPIFQPDGPSVNKGLETVDETNLGPIVETGKLDGVFGADVPGSYGFVSGGFTSSGSLKNGALTYNGTPIVVTLNGNTYTGTAGSTTIFTLTLNPTTGDYTFTLLKPFDHADTTNPNDVITLNFDVAAADSEGENAAGKITINVRDDAPDAKDDFITINESQIFTGNVVTNDIPGNDVPAKVTSVLFNGFSYTVPNSGTVTIVGNYGTLEIAATGAYTYTANSNNPNGTDAFTYTLVDSDGDSDTGLLCMTVTLINDVPVIISPDSRTVDETNLSGGTLTQTGSISANFFGDAPGVIAGNGVFSSGGSRLGNALTHNGVPVVVSYANGTYTGTAGSATVFTLVIAANGGYTFRLFEQLDHADGTNANDSIALNFGVVATDSDGDRAATTLTVNVRDDAPDAVNDTNSTSEGGAVSGNVLTNDVVGQDVSGVVTQVVFGSQTVAVPATGTVTINGSQGTLVIGASGAYTYTANANAGGTDIFTYTLKDRDGDADTATLTIAVNDTDSNPTIVKPADETLDETNLREVTQVETGTVVADFKDDAPGVIAGNGVFSSGGSRLGGALTHNGVPVVVSYANGTYTGTAGSTTVFSLMIAANGGYTFRLFEQLDHADGTNANDSIVLNFGVVATDSDGDTAATTLTVNVLDDVPIARNDVNVFDIGATLTTTGNVVSGLNGGSGAADTLSQDVTNRVTKIAFGSTEATVPATGTVSIAGAHGTLTIESNGTYRYVADPVDGGSTTPVKKQFEVGPALPDFNEGQPLSATERLSLGIAPANLNVSEGDTVTFTFVSEGAGFDNTVGAFTVLADGTLSSERITIPNGNDLPTGTINYTVGAGAVSIGFFLIANGAKLNNNYAGLNFTTGRIDFIFDYGLPTERIAKISDDGSRVKLVHVSETGVETLINGPIYFTTERGDTDNLNADDSIRVVSGVPNPADPTVLRIGFEDLPNGGDQDYNDAIFDVTITEKKDSCDKDDIRDVFTYTLTDRDGDSSAATLTIDGKDLVDDMPIFAAPAVEIVDETNLRTGRLLEGGNLLVNYGGDAPGSITANGTFSSTGSKLGGVLSSGGVPINILFVDNMYIGRAGDTTVFNFVITSAGAYTFKLFKPLDHADGANANDEITLNFGVKATDCDGDVGTTTLSVRVRDDAPVLVNDAANATEGGVVSGNVLTNDVVGQDVSGVVTQVVFGSQTVLVPATGTVTINGSQGTLVIGSNGAYTYTANANAGGTDVFTYTLKDRDGDKDTATLTIAVNDTDTTPTIVKPADETLDETNLRSGTIIESGKLTANFGDGLPGSIMGNGVFTSGGSRLGNALTHNGKPVNITYENGTYTGSVDWKTIFNLVFAENGDYTFRLFEQLDHADGTNANDSIALNFGVVATDSDGDTATTTLTVNVLDDSPTLDPSFCTLIISQRVFSSIMLPRGSDSPATITNVNFEGRDYTIQPTGVTLIETQDGILRMSSNGSYSFTADADAPKGTTREFNVTAKDFDGDTITSILQVNLIGNDLQGTPGRDTINGSASNDNITGLGAADWLYGQAGNDFISGGDGDDFIDGGTGNDVLYGNVGNDVILGRDGIDDILGNAGNDVLTGGSGADVFWVLATTDGVDRITDFGTADKLELSNVITNFDPVTDAINDFVFTSFSGGNTTISVNNAGVGGAAGATSILVLEGVNVTVADLYAGGNIIH